MTRSAAQALMGDAIALPEGAVYLGLVIRGPGPALDVSASAVPSGDVERRVVDLVGQPRSVMGRQWAPVHDAPAEVVELVDATTGELLTVVRAGPSGRPPRGEPLGAR